MVDEFARLVSTLSSLGLLQSAIVLPEIFEMDTKHTNEGKVKEKKEGKKEERWSSTDRGEQREGIERVWQSWEMRNKCRESSSILCFSCFPGLGFVLELQNGY